MRNHFHLVIETPQANLVAGIFQQTRRILFKWLNRRSQKKSYTA